MEDEMEVSTYQHKPYSYLNLVQNGLACVHFKFDKLVMEIIHRNYTPFNIIIAPTKYKINFQCL